ncbi:DUF4430 domain-containing protein [Anaerotignum lactatifermentans]|uniref:DUF4430 domain-containing protein n=1 Tax=Anaerotignum lactatifermentans TaxID=160404 RepID=A0ABS2GA87_9FIRM|nr:DUF4430 domain-containing protein [Anaerotignum lactatifermentans]MBM6829282.1 DUF4430 domain-containing protein [Anaerotignum lactatifermentans]MBM6877478.1 DUF4430 domain-containing protein [Anaerotignum lactatifermentans]MBM6950860.1 DUF4430 domain-containing protein [Anaerotignum lactatifermentans]
MNRKKTYLAGVVLVILCILAAVLYTQSRPETTEGQKALSVIVIHGDGSEKTFDYTTDAQYLGQVLEEQQLASGTEGPYGTFITTVDGETADETKEQWWCITKEGEMISTSADEAPVSDGDQYELTLKEGY